MFKQAGEEKLETTQKAIYTLA